MKKYDLELDLDYKTGAKEMLDRYNLVEAKEPEKIYSILHDVRVKIKEIEKLITKAAIELESK